MELELRNLANSIDDLADPSSLAKVLVYFEELVDEAEGYMELLTQKLEFLDVTWDQPWYHAPSPLTKANPLFYERNEKDSEKFRTDKMTTEEHFKIIKNWKRFTKKYDVPDKLRIFATWKNENCRKHRNSPEERVRLFVTAYLARGLERTLHQVFTYIKNFNTRGFESRAYSEYEEKIMEVCFMHKLEKAPPLLAIVLGRQPRGLYKRQTVQIKGKQERCRKTWNIQQASKLLNLILHYSELSLDELKYKTFEKPFWIKLQDEMERDYTYLHFFWYCNLHVQLFVKSDVKLYKLRRKLFKILRDSSYKVWSDIRWPEVLTNFPDGFTTRFLYKMCISIVKKHPRYLKTPLADLANHGLETIKSTRYTNKRLKRLKYNNEGNLEVIQYKEEEKVN